MSERNFSVYELFSIYGNLLTEIQRSSIENYYGLDLTLGEIAEIKGVSRQAVKDALDKAQLLLFEYEEKLHFYEKLTAVKNLDVADARALKNKIIGILEDK